MRLTLLLMVLLIVPTAAALEISIVPDKTSVIYPETRIVPVNILFEKGLLDKIEDIEYTISLQGPALLGTGTMKTDGFVATFDDDFQENLTVIIDDTSGSETMQDIEIRLEGEYISNAFVGGGRKYINLSENISVISTEKSKAVAEVKEVQQELTGCQAELDTCSVKVEGLNQEVQSLLEERGQLKQNMTALENELAENSPFGVYAILGGIIVVLLVVIYFLAKR